MIRCTRERAEEVLAKYDMRRAGGYKNQIIAERQNVKHVTGLTVRQLRAYLRDTAA